MPKAAAKANEAAAAPQEPKKAGEKKAAAPEKAATYTVKELIQASESALHVPKECAAAAFRIHGAGRLTLMEAKNIVEKFMKKEVE